MTREEAIQKLKEAFKSAPNKLEYEKNIQDRLQLLVWLDYERIKSDYIELDNRLRTANTENDELKRLLRLAVDDFQTAMLEEKCKVCALEHCDYDDICKWRHHDEIMNLLGGNENDND